MGHTVSKSTWTQNVYNVDKLKRIVEFVWDHAFSLREESHWQHCPVDYILEADFYLIRHYEHTETKKMMSQV